MHIPSLTAKLVLVALVLPAVCSAQRLYRWVDENGNTHFGDSIPPQYANQDREVLNDRAIVVDRQQGGLTDEQRAAQERNAAEEEARIKQAEQDRVLLRSYARVEDIEAARDRRLRQMDAQIANAEASLSDVRARLVQFEESASRYKPYSKDANAPQVPAQLAANISQAENSIKNYEAALAGYRTDREAYAASFAADLRRFKELKGLP